jgi:predicted transcriptional regulator
MGVCIQPSVVAALGKSQELKGRGLLARFLWILPDSRIGSRAYQASARWTDAAEKWAAVVREVFDLGERDPGALRNLALAGDALDVWAAFHDRTEGAMAEGGSLAGMRGWGGKAAGAVARIAGIFHLVRHRDGDPVSANIEAEDVHRAVAIVDVLTEHARSAFGLVAASPDERLARRVVEWLTRREVAAFTGREAQRGCSARAEEIARALRLLVERGYVREREGRKGGPRRPSPTYEVRPDLEASEDAA